MEYCRNWIDHGPDPSVLNMENQAMRNSNFRIAAWTGCYMQMTLMCIPPCEEIGMEMHEDTDQMIRVEQGSGMVKMRKGECEQEICRKLCKGDVVFIPAGMWHTVINTQKRPLKLSSVYAPPNHPKGTVHRTKAEAQRRGD